MSLQEEGWGIKKSTVEREIHLQLQGQGCVVPCCLPLPGADSCPLGHAFCFSWISILQPRPLLVAFSAHLQLIPAPRSSALAAAAFPSRDARPSMRFSPSRSSLWAVQMVAGSGERREPSLGMGSGQTLNSAPPESPELAATRAEEGVKPALKLGAQRSCNHQAGFAGLGTGER